MKIINILLLAVFLFGCSGDIPHESILQVEKFCSKNGGLKQIDIGYIFDDIDEINCNDNAIYKVRTASFKHYTSNGLNYDSKLTKHYNRKYKYIIKN